MKYILSILIVGLQFGILHAQEEDKYKVTEEQMKEYKKLAEQLTENLDTTLELTDEERKKVYTLKLRSLVEQHKYRMQEDELREEIRELNGEQKRIERAKNAEIREMVVDRNQQKEFEQGLRREQKHLRQYEMQRRTAKRRARREAIQKARENQKKSRDND